MPSITITSKTFGTHQVFFDEIDREIVESHVWCIKKGRKTLYATTNIGKKPNKRLKMMHKFFIENQMVDHIDCNGLNNSRKNLRPCNMKQNGFNRQINPNNTTGFKGVSFDKRAKKFEAYIQLNGKKKFLGYRNDPIEAAKLYNNAAINYIGEFAKINQI